MAEENNTIIGKIYSVFEKIDDNYGPSKLKHKPACYETREMLLECVL